MSMGSFVVQSDRVCGVVLPMCNQGMLSPTRLLLSRAARRPGGKRGLKRLSAVRVVAFEQASFNERQPVVEIKRTRIPDRTIPQEYAWREDFYEQYEWTKKLNAGSFGEVWLARHIETGQEVAVKELKPTRGRLTPQRVKQKVEQELRVLNDVGACPVVVALKEGYVVKGNYEIVMELCFGEDLKYYMKEHGPVSEQLTAAVAYEILKVLRICHDNNIVHGDVKTSNFMLKSPKCDPFGDRSVTKLEPGWLKAIDFGCSQFLQGGRRIHSRVGTPVYMAPEVFTRDFSKESDLWSLGVILFQLVSGTFPFWRTTDDALLCSINEVSHIVQTKPVDFASREIWQTATPECKHFIRRLLCKNYNKRMSLEEAEQHPFITQNVNLDHEDNIVLNSSNIVQYNTCKTNSLQ